MKNEWFDLMDCLCSPILTHDESWASAIPKRLTSSITLARMQQMALKEPKASYAEVCAFMYTRALIAPLTGDWFEIYLHVSCSVCEQLWQENHWQELEAKRQLDGWHTDLLNKLRYWIYEQRRKHLKLKLKSEKQYSKEEKIDTTFQQIQTPLFT